MDTIVQLLAFAFKSSKSAVGGHISNDCNQVPLLLSGEMAIWDLWRSQFCKRLQFKLRQAKISFMGLFCLKWELWKKMTGLYKCDVLFIRLLYATCWRMVLSNTKGIVFMSVTSGVSIAAYWRLLNDNHFFISTLILPHKLSLLFVSQNSASKKSHKLLFFIWSFNFGMTLKALPCLTLSLLMSQRC